MTKKELQEEYQKIMMETNGHLEDYVVALIQINSAINKLDEPKDLALSLCNEIERFAIFQETECGGFDINKLNRILTVIRDRYTKGETE